MGVYCTRRFMHYCSAALGTVGGAWSTLPLALLLVIVLILPVKYLMPVRQGGTTRPSSSPRMRDRFHPRHTKGDVIETPLE